MRHATFLLLLFTVLPAVAMKSRQETFLQPCDVVWKSAVAVAKRKEYRIVGISKEEQIISLAVGGVWAGERIISMNLAPGVERGCTVTVQSRFSGLVHSDGPDLLGRLHVQLIGDTEGSDSQAFKKFKDCVEYSSSEQKCEAKFRRDMAAASASSEENKQQLWNIQKQ